MAANNSQIPLFFVEQFSSNIQLKLQQEGSVLRPCVMTGTHVGSQASPVDQFGAVVANKVTTRYSPIGRIDAPTDRRWVFPTDYDCPQLLDTFDKLRLLIDPMSSYVLNAVHALGRSLDIEIMNGLNGTNYTGNNGATSTTLGSFQIVGVNTGSSTKTGLNVAKLRAARKILLQNYAWDFNKVPEIYCAVNGSQHDNLLAEVQVISSDFNGGMPVLKEGMVQRFLGINMVHTEIQNLGTDDQSNSNSTQIMVWLKDGAYAGLWADITTDISQRKDLTSLPYQAYAYGTFGGTRLEEKKVVQIWCV